MSGRPCTLGFRLWPAWVAGTSHIHAVAEGYRRHVELEPAELDRLIPAVAARPLIFDAWAYATGRRPLTDIVANRAQLQTKARQLEVSARAAFALIPLAPDRKPVLTPMLDAMHVRHDVASIGSRSSVSARANCWIPRAGDSRMTKNVATGSYLTILYLPARDRWLVQFSNSEL